MKTVIAEITVLGENKFHFVRYYKFAAVIKEIHVITNELMLVVGDGIVGMFPYGIDPHLIQ